MKKIFYTTILLLWLITLQAGADIIYLKDGTKVKAGKVWEEDDVIRFSLEDYEDIIITYSKEIVERIESGEGRAANRQTIRKDDSTAKEEAEPAESKKRPEATGTPSRSSSENKSTDQPTKTEGLEAVDVPQPKKAPQASPVKTDKSSKTGHTEAKVVPRIHAIEQKASPQTTPAGQVDGILFYNPRRAYKYWTGPNTRHHTWKEAVATLAKMFDRPPEWVEKNLGSTNNLGDIYRSLDTGEKTATPAKVKRVPTTRGLLFYDPRRPYKYWTSESSHHRTLKGALDALAGQYDRPPEWIKTHIGDTNDLGEIHKNLAKSKAREGEQ